MARVTSKLVSRGPGLSKVVADLRHASRHKLLVGVLPSARPYPDGTAVADVAAFMEFGTRTVPSRSFLRSTFDETLDETTRLKAAMLASVADGAVKPRAALAVVGRFLVTKIRAKIDSNIPPRLKPATIARKGHGRRLFETGRLRRSIAYEVRTTLGGR